MIMKNAQTLHYGFAYIGYETEQPSKPISLDPCYYLIRHRLCLAPLIALENPYIK